MAGSGKLSKSKRLSNSFTKYDKEYTFLALANYKVKRKLICLTQISLR